MRPLVLPDTPPPPKGGISVVTGPYVPVALHLSTGVSPPIPDPPPWNPQALPSMLFSPHWSWVIHWAKSCGIPVLTEQRNIIPACDIPVEDQGDLFRRYLCPDYSRFSHYLSSVFQGRSESSTFVLSFSPSLHDDLLPEALQFHALKGATDVLLIYSQGGDPEQELKAPVGLRVHPYHAASDVPLYWYLSTIFLTPEAQGARLVYCDLDERPFVVSYPGVFRKMEQEGLRAAWGLIVDVVSPKGWNQVGWPSFSQLFFWNPPYEWSGEGVYRSGFPAFSISPLRGLTSEVVFGQPLYTDTALVKFYFYRVSPQVRPSVGGHAIQSPTPQKNPVWALHHRLGAYWRARVSSPDALKLRSRSYPDVVYKGREQCGEKADFSGEALQRWRREVFSKTTALSRAEVRPWDYR